MKSKSMMFFGFVLGLGVCVLSFPNFALAQERDVDALRLDIAMFGIEEQEELLAPVAEKMFSDKEVKYIAGDDQEWFTDDDAVYTHAQIERDGSGKIFRRFLYTPGPDNVPFTYDDVLKEFQVFEYGLDGELLKEIVYDGQNEKKYAELSTAIYKYDAKGIKTERISSYTGKKIKRRTVYSYDEQGNQIQDVEYLGTDIEKYHRSEYDASGRLTKMVEYHADHNGKGPDGVWFTSDDVVSSAKESFYDVDGKMAEDNKYISPGPDGKWFTQDDQIQYYVLFEYQQ